MPTVSLADCLGRTRLNSDELTSTDAPAVEVRFSFDGPALRDPELSSLDRFRTTNI